MYVISLIRKFRNGNRISENLSLFQIQSKCTATKFSRITLLSFLDVSQKFQLKEVQKMLSLWFPTMNSYYTIHTITQSLYIFMLRNLFEGSEPMLYDIQHVCTLYVRWIESHFHAEMETVTTLKVNLAFEDQVDTNEIHVGSHESREIEYENCRFMEILQVCYFVKLLRQRLLKYRYTGSEKKSAEIQIHRLQIGIS